MLFLLFIYDCKKRTFRWFIFFLFFSLSYSLSEKLVCFLFFLLLLFFCSFCLSLIFISLLSPSDSVSSLSHLFLSSSIFLSLLSSCAALSPLPQPFDRRRLSFTLPSLDCDLSSWWIRACRGFFTTLVNFFFLFSDFFWFFFCWKFWVFFHKFGDLFFVFVFL